MKLRKQILLPVYLLTFLSFGLFTSCLEDKCDATQIYYRWDPVLIAESEIRQDPTFESVRALRNPGKIYYYKDHIFVNERREGIHIFNNQDPENPYSVGFLSIPGNVDMAIRGNVLYADNYVDLISLDISNVTSPSLLSRSEEVFPLFGQDGQGNYIVDYLPTEITEEVECNDPNFGQQWFWNGPFFLDNNRPETTAGSGNNIGTPSGIAGSMASFALVDDHLYVVDENSLKVFSLDNNGSADFLTTNYFSWGIETIFPYGENLFIGTMNGMHIFDNSDLSNPQWIAAFAHANACDPVFVKGTTAYVTLRDGTECETFTNQLDIVDISTLTNPTLVESYQMDNPHGLSVRNDELYLCEGDYGLKVFDVADPLAVDQNMLSHVRSLNAYDVISLSDDHLLLVGSDGLYQFDVSDARQPREFSLIPVEK